jgi:hypothetical protein
MQRAREGNGRGFCGCKKSFSLRRCRCSITCIHSPRATVVIPLRDCLANVYPQSPNDIIAAAARQSLSPFADVA